MSEDSFSTMDALALWYYVSLRGMKELDIELSSRQTSVLMHVYLFDGPHTIKSLFDSLGMSKAAICRAIDQLSALNLLKRKKDADDKRNVFINRTTHGSVFLSDFADIILQETGVMEKKVIHNEYIS